MFNSLRKTRIKNGFTLIELLLYMAFFTIFLAITLQMFSAILNIQLESASSSSISSDGQFIINRFVHDVRQAQSILLPVEKGVPSQTFAVIIDNQTLTYNIDSGNLILDNGNGKDQLNGTQTNLLDISFLRLEGGDGKDIVQMSFTLNSKIVQKAGEKSEIFQTSAAIR